MNKYDVHLETVTRTLTVAKGIRAENECDAIREAGAAIMARNNQFHKFGREMHKHGEIFSKVEPTNPECTGYAWESVKAIPEFRIAL